MEKTNTKDHRRPGPNRWFGRSDRVAPVWRYRPIRPAELRQSRRRLRSGLLLETTLVSIGFGAVAGVSVFTRWTEAAGPSLGVAAFGALSVLVLLLRVAGSTPLAWLSLLAGLAVGGVTYWGADQLLGPVPGSSPAMATLAWTGWLGGAAGTLFAVEYGYARRISRLR